jgi:hypothetical protein
MSDQSPYEEIPSAEDRSWVIQLTYRELLQTPAPFMVGQYGFNGTCNMFPAVTFDNALAIAQQIEDEKQCWTCIIDRNGVQWQAFIALELREDIQASNGQRELFDRSSQS